MGFYVHVHVCFACDDYDDGLAALAAKHLGQLTKAEDEVSGARHAAKWFLTDLSQREGTAFGPKGGLHTWGMVGNYTCVDGFVEELRPFWDEMLRTGAGGICDFERIMVFGEPEQSEQATAYEVFLHDDGDRELAVRKHACPFTWMQM